MTCKAVCLLCSLLVAGNTLLLLPSLQVLHGVRAALHAAFSSSPQHPAYVSTLQGMAAVDRGIWIEPMAVAAAAHASGGLQAAVAQLEEQMMFSGR